MLRFISYAREVAPAQACEDDWRAYWLILDGDELLEEGRSKQTFSTKSRAIGYADAAMADWYMDYQDAAANAA